MAKTNKQSIIHDYIKHTHNELISNLENIVGNLVFYFSPKVCCYNLPNIGLLNIIIEISQ